MVNNILEELGAGVIAAAVDVVIFNEEGKVLLGKRLTKTGNGHWGPPGGHIRSEEKIVDAANRELREELGEKIKVRVTGELIGVRENSLPPDRIHHLTVIIKGYYISGEPQVAEPDMCERWEWFSLENLPSPLFSGVEQALKNYQQGKALVISDWG